VSDSIKKKRRRCLQSPGLIAESEVLEKRAYVNNQYEKNDGEKKIIGNEESVNIDSSKRAEKNEEIDDKIDNKGSVNVDLSKKAEKNEEIDDKVSRKLAFGQTEKKSLPPPRATNDLPVLRDKKTIDLASYNIHEPKFWIVFFLFIQMAIYFRYPFLRDPFLASLTNFSESSILRYKSILGVKPKVVKQIERVEIAVPVPPPKQIKVVKNIIKDDSEILEHVKGLVGSKDSFIAFQNDRHKLGSNVNVRLEDVKLKLLKKRQLLEVWKENLEAVEKELHELLETPPHKMSVDNVVEALKDLNETSKISVQAELVLATDVPMWKIVSSSGCPQLPSNLRKDPVITMDAIDEKIDSIKEDAQKMVAEAENDKEIRGYVKEWVEEVLEDVGIPEEGINPEEEFDFVTDEEEEDLALSIGMTEEEVQNVINQRMESNLAERIGIFDAASLFNGAELIRSGTRATTPSLTESLPLLNRYMAYSKLQFYGFDAEVALTPTVPHDGVGQCWSFENASKSKNPRWKAAYQNERANGRFASLTVRFAKLVSPKRVVIEHVASPKKRPSAIRDFRLIGYEDHYARGDPLDLGSFQFHSAAGPSQEFWITGIEKDVMIGSITLAVDSAHRQDFACLYRFKVMEK